MYGECRVGQGVLPGRNDEWRERDNTSDGVLGMFNAPMCICVVKPPKSTEKRLDVRCWCDWMDDCDISRRISEENERHSVNWKLRLTQALRQNRTLDAEHLGTLDATVINNGDIGRAATDVHQDGA